MFCPLRITTPERSNAAPIIAPLAVNGRTKEQRHAFAAPPNVPDHTPPRELGVKKFQISARRDAPKPRSCADSASHHLAPTPNIGLARSITAGGMSLICLIVSTICATP